MEKPLTRPAFSGEELRIKINSAPEKRTPLIEGLIYENSIVLNSADPGVGKSTLTACWMAQASAGLPVFGQLFVPRPLVIYYIPFERGTQEIEERFRHIQNVIPIEYDNIFLNEHFMGLNVINDAHADDIVRNIRNDIKSRHIDVMVLDPIYQAVAGGLSTDEKASQFTRFSTRLQVEFKCSNWMNHHTVKDSYSSQSGAKIEKDDPFYGSQWLKAHCTAGYYMKRNPATGGVIMVNKKDSHSNLLHELPLCYEPETYTLFLKGIDNSVPVRDRLLMAYRSFKKAQKRVTFREIQGCLGGVSDSHLRNLLDTPPFDTAFTRVKSIGSNTLYVPEIDL